MHTSHLVSSAIYNSKYELLRHPPNYSDLVPSDYFLFPVLKDYLKGRYYNDRSSLGSSTHQCLNSLSEDDLTAAIQKLPERWQVYFGRETIFRARAHALIIVMCFVVLYPSKTTHQESTTCQHEYSNYSYGYT